MPRPHHIPFGWTNVGQISSSNEWHFRITSLRVRTAHSNNGAYNAILSLRADVTILHLSEYPTQHSVEIVPVVNKRDSALL
ncbi:hypothetical protein FRC12_016060 [Ceratobasidium sp. 428]|nr:hypothetical protein FRC12_016060 [Ceratobasidium sp. 428]